MTQTNYGEIAYNAYCNHRAWKGFDGSPLPQWPDVKPDIQEGWRKAADTVALIALTRPSAPGGNWDIATMARYMSDRLKDSPLKPIFLRIGSILYPISHVSENSQVCTIHAKE